MTLYGFIDVRFEQADKPIAIRMPDLSEKDGCQTLGCVGIDDASGRKGTFARTGGERHSVARQSVIPFRMVFRRPPEMDVRPAWMDCTGTAQVSEMNRFDWNAKGFADGVDVLEERVVLDAQDLWTFFLHLLSFLSRAFGKTERDCQKSGLFPCPSLRLLGTALYENTERGSRCVRALLARVVHTKLSKDSSETTLMQKADVVAGWCWVSGGPVGRGLGKAPDRRGKGKDTAWGAGASSGFGGDLNRERREKVAGACAPPCAAPACGCSRLRKKPLRARVAGSGPCRATRGLRPLRANRPPAPQITRVAECAAPRHAAATPFFNYGAIDGLSIS